MRSSRILQLAGAALGGCSTSAFGGCSSGNVAAVGSGSGLARQLASWVQGAATRGAALADLRSGSMEASTSHSAASTCLGLMSQRLHAAAPASLHRSPLPSTWSSLWGPVRFCQPKGPGQLSRQRVPKSAGINNVIMPNTTQLQYGLYGIRAITGQRVAANTIEAVRRTVRRKIKKSARLWVRLAATVPVTRKPMGIRMGKGKGAIDFYATPVRPGQIIFEMDRVPRQVALQALEAAQHKFPCKLGFVEWS